MAETNQLQRIADLVTRVGRIGRKQRGMRIEAEEWNSLVEVLQGILQVERLQEESRQGQLEQRFAARAHEHLGEVSLAWLDPDLQGRIGGGSDAVSTRATVADLEAKVKELTAANTNLRELVERQQQTLDRSAVAELGRARALQEIQTRFDGIANLRTLVGTLSADVGSLRTNVTTVLELRNSLRDVTGAPIDVAGLRREVSDLQQLRDNFKGVDGRTLTMKDLELRLSDVAVATGVGGVSLDQRFSDFSAQLETRFNGRTDSAIETGLKGLRDESAALADALRGEIKTSGANVSVLAATEAGRLIAENNVRQNAALDVRFSASRTDITAAATDAARGIVTQQLAQVPEIARAAAQAAASDVGRGITADLQTRFTAEIAAQVRATETRLDGRLRPLEAGVPELRNSLPGLITAGVTAEVGRAQTTLSQQFNAQIATVQQQMQSTVGQQVTSTVNAALGNLDARITAGINANLPAINAQVNNAVSSATRGLNEQVAGEVDRQLGELKIDEKLKAAQQATSREIQTTVAGQLAAQEARLTTLISKTADTVRGETKALVDSSVSQTRGEILGSVDKRFSNLRLNQPIAVGGGGAVVIR